VFHDPDANENYEILGENCHWILRHGWYVRLRAQDAGEDEDPETVYVGCELKMLSAVYSYG
jgi:hypothetical protein